MSEELKPCPFCGSKQVRLTLDNLFNDGYYVICECGGSSACVSSPELATNHWNTRATGNEVKL